MYFKGTGTLKVLRARGKNHPEGASNRLVSEVVWANEFRTS